MKIGFVGLGKLGLPTAVTIAMQGHDVVGYDISEDRMTKAPQKYQEQGPNGGGDFNTYLAKSSICFGLLETVVRHADILFVAVQTPHVSAYGGATPLPADRVDFDYSYLIESVRRIADCCDTPTILAVISTVLPGTMRREIKPMIEANDNLRLAYNPSFIAMGTVMQDFLNPEFVLLGCDDAKTRATMRAFYLTIHDAKSIPMSVESAELTKVAYNTFISTKIAFANTVMEICHKIPGANCDNVMDALKLADRRLISSAYLTPGMGDGGGCHPRDNIAMSHLARTLGLSFDVFEAAMECREKQTDWIAKIAAWHATVHGLPIVILGKAFKPETNLLDGSPAMLLGHQLENWHGHAVTYADDNIPTETTEDEATSKRSIFIIGCRHERFSELRVPKGSIVIDPHRFAAVPQGVRVIRLGTNGGEAK